MAKSICSKMFCHFLFFVLLEIVLAIHDPALTGIKTRAYQRDPIISAAYDRQSSSTYQTQHTSSDRYTTAINQGGYYAKTNNDDDDSNVNYNAHSRAHPLEAAHYVQPIYERQRQNINGWQDAENSLTEYYSGCPSGHTGLLPYAYDCRRFLNCFKGRAHIQSCGPGTVFNPQTLECDRPDKVLCGANAALGQKVQQQQQTADIDSQRAGRLIDLEPRCTPGLSGFQPHPTDCTQFLNCVNGQTYVQQCALGTAYSIPLMGCDYKHKVDCGERTFGAPPSKTIYVPKTRTNLELTCPRGLRGLHPHSYDRQRYLNCAPHRAPYVESCNAGTTFDSINLVCGFSAKDQQILKQTTLSQLSSTHAADILCPSNVTGYFAHPFDNTKFLHCKSGVTAVQSCPAGQVFGISEGYCLRKQRKVYTDVVAYIVSMISYEYSLMTTSCPPGTEGLHLYPYDGQKYILCHEGNLTVFNCGDDMAYSISRKICLPRRSIEETDHVKFYAEFVRQTKSNSFSYMQMQTFETPLKQCPRSLTGLYPFPFDSSKYILCQNGVLQVETCASGKVFSLSKRACWLRADLGQYDFVITYELVLNQTDLYAYISTANEHAMLDLRTVSCPPNAHGLYLHPFDCTKYLICREQQTIVESCPKGDVYSITKRKCVARDSVEPYERVEYLDDTKNEFSTDAQTEIHVGATHETEVSCAPGASGLQPHPHDCSKFLNCANGQTYVQNCGPGTAWSIPQQICDYAHKVDCATRSGRVKVGQFQIKCPADVYGLYAHPFDYSKFLRCTNGHTLLESCYEGNVFSISRSYCLPQENVATKDRVSFLSWSQISLGASSGSDSYVYCPSGFEGAYLYPFDCTKYISCHAGSTDLSECPAGTHFSISHGACLAAAQVERSDRVYTMEEVRYLLNWQRNYAKKEASSETIACPPGLIGMYHHPYDAYKFLSCSATGALIFDCPPNNVFSISRRICVASQDVSESDRSQFEEKTYFDSSSTSTTMTTNTKSSTAGGDLVKCAPNASGFQPHPYICTKYLNCANGVTYVQDCPPGTAWETQSKLCDFISKVDCSERQGDTVEGKNFQVHVTVADNQVNCPANANGLLPHPYECTKFLNCDDGRTTIQDCGPGTAWNAQLEVCDYIDKVDCQTPKSKWTGRENNANRDAKSHTSSNGYYGVQSTTTTQSTDASGDRWSKMHMQRPAGHGYGQTQQLPSLETPTPIWSGQGIYVDQQTPTKTVLYVEGSLTPNSNYAPIRTTYQTPLAPMATSTATDDFQTNTNLFYAQPANSVEDNTSHDTLSPRTNYNREINYAATPNTGWQPINQYSPTPTSTSTSTFSSPNYFNPHQTVPQLNTQLMPPYEDGDDDDMGQRPLLETVAPKQVTTINVDDLPGNRQFVLSEPDQFSSASNLHGNLQPSQSSAWVPIIKSKKNSTHNAYPNHRPNYAELSTTTRSTDIPYSNQRPTYATLDADNLYGGLLPPKIPSTTPRQPVEYSPVLPPPTKPTQPSIVQSLPNYSILQHANPHYSPSYAGVAHSYNATWAQSTVKKQPSQEERRGQLPPPYNTQYYSSPKPPQTQNELHDDTSDDTNLPISEAIRLLLRPYLNRSGTVHETDAQRAESHIMSVINSATPVPTPRMTTTVTVTSPTTTTTSTNREQLELDVVPPEDDVELILAGEQETLRKTITVATNVDAHNIESNFKTTNHSNWHFNGHSKDYHQRHPNLPNTFQNSEIGSSSNNKDFQQKNPEIDSTESDEKTPDFKHNHRHHHHHHSQHNHHSVGFHNKHPELPNPFENSEKDQVKHYHQHFHRRHPGLPNPFANNDEDDTNTKVEATTPRTGREHGNGYGQVDIDSRSSFDDKNVDCEFNCGDGKCIKQLEVCDGVNNCGNRKDESQCDYLGYELRLTGGESPNMGRLEVKILGKWGYVCDDKFGLRDADVACKELGFKLGANEVRGNSYYPPTDINFSYTMDEVECRGNETKLKDCDFKGWGVNNCGPDEVVGIVCKVPQFKCPNNYWLCSTSKECIPPTFVCDNTKDCADESDESEQVCNAPIEYRLEGGRSANEGRLEIKYRGEWGTVCDDDFTQKEAQVACNSLGFYGPPRIEKNIFGLAHGPIWLDQVSCFGNETSIDKCNHWNWGEHNCNHTEDVGLHCTVGPPPRRSTTLHSVDDNSFPEQQNSAEDRQTAFEDIGIYAGWERSSKFLKNQRRCGHFKDDVVDEYAHPEQRVVNGTVARRGRHPWQATIRTRGRGGISSHWCGAVLISKRHLLTAAHCLAGYPKGSYFVRMGDHYANIAESSEVDSYIENWYIHEKFRDKSHMNNDIAVIVLKTPVRFNDYVQPICLPEKGSKITENRMCTISGWGSIKSGVSTPSNILRAAQLPILSDDTCKQTHVYGNALTEGMFCAGYMDESVDACDGDSGGPLVCSDDDGETLYGIISWGQHCGYVNKPGVYVRVEKYIDWIYEKINFSLQQASH